MLESFLPAILRPSFSWHLSTAIAVSETTPSTPSVPNRLSRLAWGHVHRALHRLSKWYCWWLDIPCGGSVRDLPFGLVLKWSERTRVEEVVAMKTARAAGIPAPMVLSCGEHHGNDFPISILMTRLPGKELQNWDEPLEIDREGAWLSELDQCLQAMRKWKSPFNQAICSALSTSIASHRVPYHKMGPFSNEKQLMEYLLTPTSIHGFISKDQFDAALADAKELSQNPHRIVFTHGDFETHNILVDKDGHLSGFIDWECAGWYPEYWEFTTTMRWSIGTWWWHVASFLGGHQYLEELRSDKALNALTAGSYIGM